MELLRKAWQPIKVRKLVKEARDKNEHIATRKYAVEALGEIKHPNAVRHLIRMLRNRKLRLVAAEALGHNPHPDAIPPLAKALQDADKDMRWSAAWALGRIGHESAVPHLAKALQDNDSEVRDQAAESLGMIGRAIQGKKVEGKEAKALQLVGAHFQENEGGDVIRKATLAALEGKVTKENARLFVKQLRAVKGKMK